MRNSSGVSGGLTPCLAAVPGVEICDGKDNDCDSATDEATCDDGNPCTDDLCTSSGDCLHTNNTQPCDADGTVCTQGDLCTGGACVPGPALICDDKNLCTSDSCDAGKGCVFLAAVGVPCDADENPCTLNDSCAGGACVPGATKACDSGDPCVEGKCSVLTGACKYQSKEGVPCDDGDPCTAGDACAGEACQGSAVTCDDKNPCTADSCITDTGCAHKNLTAPCDDGNPATKNDACLDGLCVAG